MIVIVLIQILFANYEAYAFAGALIHRHEIEVLTLFLGVMMLFFALDNLRVMRLRRYGNIKREI